ncbi:bacterial low temperature requirement A protein-domain-containing protein [Paraphoma chrysanthemicola]|nr:bacterial low temperature requirement A protein-domain-containing protein [Paraphoma chrysanthemicola]
MDLARYFSTRRKEQSHHHSSSHGSTNSKHDSKSYLPLLASPINDDIREVLSCSLSDLEKMNTTTSTRCSTSDTTTLAGNGRTSRGNIIIYKQHHEASTIELFYDLFFVANLAYFTAMHQHTDAQSLINYLKLFTMIWFTWLSVTLFDVRFSIDCVWNRLHKAIQFGVFTGFVFAGPVFDKYSNSHDAMSYKNFAIVLVVSRTAIALQYAVVMWQGRMFRQTLIPLGLSTLVHAIAAAGYGITIAVFPRGAIGLEEQIPWVVISIAEGLVIFFIAITWRIVSFKYTHLVERLQLLTLIIIGEGIIGMVKSVACITKGQSTNNHTEIGTVVAAVVILYLLWMLYFDQLSHDRFGTVRQQLWSLLHYPLHMAILLCVEGNTSLIVWNSAVQALKWIWSVEPRNYADPGAGFNDTADLLSHLNRSMWAIDARFESKYWNATYKWETNLTAITNYTNEYGYRTDEWNNRTSSLIRYMFDNAQVFIFEAHADTVGKLNAVSAPATDPRQRLDRIFDVFNTTVMQFYIGGGAILLVLALMYWFNKVHKTKYEFGEMINRVVVGFALIIVGVAAVIGNKTTSGFKFTASHWIIPIVVLSFVAVLALDNFLLAISHHTSRRTSHRPGDSYSSTITDGNESDTAGLISKYPSNTPRSGPPSALLSHVQTAYAPYDSPQERDFASPKMKLNTPPRPTGGIRTPDSGITLRSDNDKDAIDDKYANFSYQNTPVDGQMQGLGIGHGVTVRPLERQFSQAAVLEGGAKWRSKDGYEGLGTVEEGVYGGEEYMQHPMRVRTVKGV